MSELYIKPLQDYFKQLCVQHTDVLHDDATNVAFIRFQTKQDLGSIKNNAAGVFIIMDNLVGRVKGAFEENKLAQEITLLFLVRTASPDGNTYGVIEAAQEKALEIMFDFYARLKYDFEQDDCGPLKYLDATKMNFEPVDGPVEEYHFGWLMSLPLDVNLPDYNPDKWISA